MGIFANSENPDEMQHDGIVLCDCISSGSTLFVKVKKIFRQKNAIFF